MTSSPVDVSIFHFFTFHGSLSLRARTAVVYPHAAKAGQRMRVLREQLCSFFASVPLIADHQDVGIGLACIGSIRGHSGSGELSIA
jgi:hypothetical protein